MILPPSSEACALIRGSFKQNAAAANKASVFVSNIVVKNFKLKSGNLLETT